MASSKEAHPLLTAQGSDDQQGYTENIAKRTEPVPNKGSTFRLNGRYKQNSEQIGKALCERYRVVIVVEFGNILLLPVHQQQEVLPKFL